MKKFILISLFSAASALAANAATTILTLGSSAITPSILEADAQTNHTSYEGITLTNVVSVNTVTGAQFDVSATTVNLDSVYGTSAKFAVVSGSYGYKLGSGNVNNYGQTFASTEADWSTIWSANATTNSNALSLLTAGTGLSSDILKNQKSALYPSGTYYQNWVTFEGLKANTTYTITLLLAATTNTTVLGTYYGDVVSGNYAKVTDTEVKGISATSAGSSFLTLDTTATAITLDVTSNADGQIAIYSGGSISKNDATGAITTAGANNKTTFGLVAITIPEPSMFGLLAGTLGLALAGTRRRRKSSAGTQK